MSASTLVPVFLGISVQAISAIADHWKDIVKYGKIFHLFGKRFVKKVLNMKGGNFKKNAKAIWKMFTAVATTDFVHFWKSILVLMKSGLVKIAEHLFPSHYKENSDPKVVDPAMSNDVAHNDNDTDTDTEELGHTEDTWLTGNKDEKNLIQGIRSSGLDSDDAIELLHSYVKTHDSGLKSVHPNDADEYEDNKDGTGMDTDTDSETDTDKDKDKPKPKPKPKPIPDKPITPNAGNGAKLTGTKKALIVVVVVAIAIALIVTICLVTGVLYYNSNKTPDTKDSNTVRRPVVDPVYAGH